MLKVGIDAKHWVATCSFVNRRLMGQMQMLMHLLHDK